MLSDQESICEIYYLRNLKIESLCILLQKLYVTAFSLTAVVELIFVCNASQSTLKVLEKHFHNSIYSIKISESLNRFQNCQVWNGMEQLFNRTQQPFITALFAFAVIFQEQVKYYAMELSALMQHQPEQEIFKLL